MVCHASSLVEQDPNGDKYRIMFKESSAGSLYNRELFKQISLNEQKAHEFQYCKFRYLFLN
jgi:hypothetical protein